MDQEPVRLGQLRKELYAWLEVKGFRIDDERHAMIKAFCSAYATAAKEEVLAKNKKIFDFYSARQHKK